MVILASQSPRRRELLKVIFADFAVRPANCDEISRSATPDGQVTEIAIQKARTVARTAAPDDLVIAADTCVAIEGRILGKPKNREDAFEMLTALSGETHTVYTGVAVLWQGKLYGMCEQTDVTFHPLSAGEIRAYIETGEPMDKAGAYGIQEKGALLVDRIEGDFYNVMGLPISALSRLLRKIGALPDYRDQEKEIIRL